MSDATPTTDIVTELREREADLTQQVALAEARLEEVRAMLELLAPTRRKPGRKPGWKQRDAELQAPLPQAKSLTEIEADIASRQDSTGAIYNPEGAL